MAATLTMVKAPNIQKVLVLVLLTLSGLGYPPPLCEAVDCYDCTAVETPSKPTPDTDCKVKKDCASGWCHILRNSGAAEGTLIVKTCSETPEGANFGAELFHCLQKAMGQDGTKCLKGKQSEINSKSECYKRSGGSNTNEAGKREGPPVEDILVEICVCNTNECNVRALLGDATTGTGGGKGGSGGADSVMGTGRKMKLIWGMTILLATNWLFY